MGTQEGAVGSGREGEVVRMIRLLIAAFAVLTWIAFTGALARTYHELDLPWLMLAVLMGVMPWLLIGKSFRGIIRAWRQARATSHAEE